MIIKIIKLLIAVLKLRIYLSNKILKTENASHKVEEGICSKISSQKTFIWTIERTSLSKTIRKDCYLDKKEQT